MDHLIRETLCHDVTEQEPSANVRDKLLAQAVAPSAESKQVVGSAIPPLVSGLRENTTTAANAVRLPEFESELMDFFGSAQQRLVSMWILSTSTRF